MRDGCCPSSDVPKIQWNSNPHCPYGYLAIGNLYLFSSPGRSPGRAIVLPSASALASALALALTSALAKRLRLKFFM